MKKNYQAAIFDMDGTILDTIEDLKDALNYSMARFGHRADFAAQETCLFFGGGARVAVTRALAAEAGWSDKDILKIGTPEEPTGPVTDEETIQEILDFYKSYYAAHADIKTGPYPGIPQLLQRLAQLGVSTAVISNKPDPAVQSLCRDYFPDLFSYSAGEIAGIPRKPAPDMIHAALDKLGASPEETVYIGDSEVDIETARNAGLDCICVDWGFRTRDYLISSGAARIVSTCDELLERIVQSDDGDGCA